MYKLTHRFTSQDGRLAPDSREYGISQEEINLLGDAKPHLGGATHIFVKINGGTSNQARFFTRDNGLTFVRSEKPESGWAEYEMAKASTYKPHLGERGWWNATVEGAPSQVAEDIGLPDSWHVSTFLIFDWVEDGTVDPEEPVEPEEPGNKILKLEFSISAPGYAAAVQLFTDGTYTLDEVNG